mmetsp:Transcript_906/g.2111  ORF Transcript_906/g.2111 Transcript_906/m.2111 type:complete len:430 (-) Transcript_906:1023-2312(-)
MSEDSAGKRKRRHDGHVQVGNREISPILASQSNEHGYVIADLKQWFGGRGQAQQILPLVDLRSLHEFDARRLSFRDGHSRKTTIVNLPLDSLLSGDRSCELPPRNLEFAILVPKTHVRTFSARNGCVVHDLFFSLTSKSTKQTRKPWMVKQVMFDNDELWNAADELNLLRSKESASKILKQPRLWNPDPLVTELMPLLKNWLAHEPDNQIGLVYDLGSGAGRDVCYLAEETKEFLSLEKCNRSLHFVGVDNHKGSARRCGPLWKSRGAKHLTGTCLLDLNRLKKVQEHFVGATKSDTAVDHGRRSTVLCLYAVRFLNRKLLTYIASATDKNNRETDDDATTKTSSKQSIHAPPSPLELQKGTIIAISHFCKPHVGAPWPFEHPKETSVLDRHELTTMFSSKNWHVMRDEIVRDGDHGRNLIQFIARKAS